MVVYIISPLLEVTVLDEIPKAANYTHGTFMYMPERPTKWVWCISCQPASGSGNAWRERVHVPADLKALALLLT